MFGSVVLGIDDKAFEERSKSFKKHEKAKLDTDLTADDLKELVRSL